MKFIPVLLATAVSLLGTARLTAEEISPASVLTVMQRVADWQLAHPPTNRPTSWVPAAGDVGMMALAGISGDAKYRDAMLAKGETNRWELPAHQGRQYHADDQCIGQVWAELYFLHRENKMIAPMRERFDFILANPSTATNLNFGQPKGKSQELWSWCDALFMAPPAWVRLYVATGDTRYLDFAVTNWWRTTDYLYDQDEHLFFRDSTFFKKPEANGKKIFWSRGNGWVFAGIVRMLEYLPTNHPDRPRFEKLFKEMADKIVSLQQADGLWRSSLLDPESFPLQETSGSGFFTYGFAWGVNQGLLDHAKFEPAVRKGWSALVNCVETDGKLTHVQPVGSDPKKFAPESTEAYGVGAFLLAGSEVYRMAVFSQSSTNGKISATNDDIMPELRFDEVPVSIAIENMAQVAKIKYVLDPNVGYGQEDKSKNTKTEPEVTVRWTDITMLRALELVLDSVGLQMNQDSKSKTLQISNRSSGINMRLISSPILLKVKNPSDFWRDSETVEIADHAIEPDAPPDVFGVFKNNYVVVDGLSSRVLGSQVYCTGTNKVSDKLLFQADFAPNETKTFYILDASALAATPPPIVKTFARYVPERMDDFAWESDRTAHRMYGQALIKGEGTITSGMDAWIKKDHRLIMDEMYRTKHYHEDNGSEMDDYRVGKSCGDGGSGIWDGKKLHAPINYRNWKLITTGPIRSEFEVTYDAWDAGGGRMVSSTKRISIDAGSWMSKAQDTFASEDKSPLTVGVGLAERACPTNRFEFIANDLNEGWQAYWQPEDQPKGTMGVAVILPKGEVSAFTNDAPNLPDAVTHTNVPQPTHEGYPPMRSLLAISQAQVGKPFTYYFGACWDRSGDFTNHVQWENYIKRFAERRDQPLQVTVGN